MFYYNTIQNYRSSLHPPQQSRSQNFCSIPQLQDSSLCEHILAHPPNPPTIITHQAHAEILERRKETPGNIRRANPTQSWRSTLLYKPPDSPPLSQTIGLKVPALLPSSPGRRAQTLPPPPHKGRGKRQPSPLLGRGVVSPSPYVGRAVVSPSPC